MKIATTKEIKLARYKLGLTQEQAANKLGLVRQTYANYEKHPGSMPASIYFNAKKLLNF